MEYENMRVAELKALARERGLIGYSRLRKADLIGLLQNKQQCTIPLQSWAPDIPRPPPSVRFRQPPWSGGLRAPTQHEMDIFEQQEMSKSRPQVKSKLNDWYDWLVNHVPKTVKDKASRAFKTLRIRLWGCIMGLLVLVIRPGGA